VAGCRYYFKGDYAGTCITKSSSTDAKSDQVWLWYDQILDVVEVRSSLPSDEVSFDFFIRPSSSGLVVKQCGIRPLYAPLYIMQSSNEEEATGEGKRAYHEFENNKTPTSYTLTHQYARPRDKGLELSLKERISGYHTGHFGKSIPSISCATNVVDLQMQHNRYGNCAEVIVGFGLVGRSPPQPLHDLQYLARQIQDYYCYFDELVDNINVFSSLMRLFLYDCNIESLAASIKHLSSLEELSLMYCKRLMSLPNLPPSLRRLSVVECTSLETVEFAEENSMIFYGVSNVMGIYDKVSRIQVTDPGASVTDWHMKMSRSRHSIMIIVFNVDSSSTKSLNSMCVGDTVKVTIT
jgi:hypothetical protein